MTNPDEMTQLRRECAAVSDKLNNLLTAIYLKADLLAITADDKHVAAELHKIAKIAEEAASYSAMLRRLSDTTSRT
jgi:hypothetical protein